MLHSQPESTYVSQQKRPSEIIFVRHAESDRNAVKQGNVYFADDAARAKVYGVPDHRIQITERGREQARITGVYMRDRFKRPHFVYHTGYARTEQTMELVLAAQPKRAIKKIQVRMNPFIREREPGFAYDMTTAEAENAFPWLQEYWQTFGGFFARPPGGESLSDVLNRVYTFVNMLFRDRQGKCVWVFTHGGTLRLIRMVLERWDYEQALRWPKGQSPQNCGITRYAYDTKKKRLTLTEYNTTAWKE